MRRSVVALKEAYLYQTDIFPRSGHILNSSGELLAQRTMVSISFQVRNLALENRNS